MVVVQWPPEFGRRVALWDAVYAQDAAAVQKLLATPRGVQQVNVASGVASFVSAERSECLQCSSEAD